MPGTCWFIGKGTAGARSTAELFARLRGIETRHCDSADSLPDKVREPVIVVIDAPRLDALHATPRRHLAHLAEDGAVVYVRGMPNSDGVLDLSPFVQSRLPVARECSARGYRFTASRTLPAALAGEEVRDYAFAARGAERLPAQAEALLILRHADGNERTAIFGLRYGKGQVICDLLAGGEDCSAVPLVERLADPQTRYQSVGALLAANCAMNSEAPRLPPFNLIIDDRPVNFDHFNTEAVGALLRHIEEACPGAHTDFAWTPWHTNPCRGYLEAMKQFPTGFVWHGFHRHVDHSLLVDPRAELAKGRLLVSEIEKRFDVRLQRIMIFPFERGTAEQFRLLQEAGFLACVEQPSNAQNFDPRVPPYLGCSMPSITEPSCGFLILYRYRMEALTRDRMLAMAALGLPIIAYAHPEELRLRRFARLLNREGNIAHFDPVLTFAASKGLRPRSLEEIATEVEAAYAASAT